jgi:hypothetical protein
LLVAWPLGMVALQYILYGPQQLLEVFNLGWSKFYSFVGNLALLLWPFFSASYRG